MKSRIVLAGVSVTLVAIAGAGCSSTSGEPESTTPGDNFCSAYVNFEIESMRIGRDFEAAGGTGKADLPPLQARLVTAIDDVKAAVPADAPATVTTVFAEMSKVAANENYKPPLNEGQQREFMGWMAHECPTIEADLKTAKAALVAEVSGSASANPSS